MAVKIKPPFFLWTPQVHDWTEAFEFPVEGRILIIFAEDSGITFGGA